MHNFSKKILDITYQTGCNFLNLVHDLLLFFLLNGISEQFGKYQERKILHLLWTTNDYRLIAFSFMMLCPLPGQVGSATL